MHVVVFIYWSEYTLTSNKDVCMQTEVITIHIMKPYICCMFSNNTCCVLSENPVSTQFCVDIHM